METAAAILTTLAFEHNDTLKSQLNAFNADAPKDLEAVIIPVFRQILSAIRRENPNGGADQNPSRDH